jgi:phosphomannomutase/phosphoglucomutase
VIGYVLLGQQIEQKAAQRGEQVANVAVGQITESLSRYTALVQSAAQDPALEMLMLSRDAEALTQRELDLKRSFTAQRVLLIPAVDESRWLGNYPALSYAELDMVLAAKGGAIPAIEAYTTSQGDHFDVIRPVVYQKVIVGYVLASFDAAVVQRLLAQMDIKASYIALIQNLGSGEAKVLAGQGEDAVKSSRELITLPVPESHWQMQIWQQNSAIKFLGVNWWIVYWLVTMLILALLGVVLRIVRRSLERALRDDGQLCVQFVRDRLQGNWMGKEYTPRLSEFSQVVADLRASPWQHASIVAATSAAEASEKVTTEAKSKSETSYIDLLFQSKDAIAVEEKQPIQIMAGNYDELPQSIFRTYDIRGIVGRTLTPEIVYDIGLAIGSEAWKCGEQTLVVGRDGRLSSPQLADALIAGLRASGRNVINLGRVPTPLVYFATHYLSARSGVMITGSHNPVDYNGLKIVLKGETLAQEAIQGLYQRIIKKDFTQGAGSLTAQDLVADYIARVCTDVRVRRPLRVVVDCGNGVAGDVAPALLRNLGCEVIALYCDVDGQFPNHHPDPSQPENLVDLIAAVKRNHADVGLAIDGDGDRLGVVDSRGQIIWPDRQLMLYAIDVLKSNPGAQIIYDVKCSRNLQDVIAAHGGRPVMWRSGHSVLKAKLKEDGALLAGEMSGHIFFNDRWFGFDDACYTAARLLEILGESERSSAEAFALIPDAISTPELRLDMVEGAHYVFMERIKKEAKFPDAELITLDGVRAEFVDGWGLVRASNTTPCLTLRFEADNAAALERIKQLFRKVLMGLDASLKLPF